MFNKWRKYSYADQKSYLSRVRLNIFRISGIILAYILLTNVVFSAFVMESSSMSPSIQSGDRMIFFSFSARGFFPHALFFNELPFERGDIVTVNLDAGEESLAARAVDRFLRFFTAGRVGVSKDERFFIKRVIALPGDEISMINYVMQVRPAGSPFMLTEYEQRFYNIDIPQTPSIWDESIPFSGAMATRTLGAGECFVLSDDRSNTNDSRTWGPVSVRAITAKALFRYWPLTRVGLP